MNNEIQHMLVRLFRRAWVKWNISQRRCAEVFDNYDLDRYIADMYEFFHVQGDEANIEDIEHHLECIGASYDH